MDSSVSPQDEIWFPRVCHHISKAVYQQQADLESNDADRAFVNFPLSADTTFDGEYV
jgi:hypothetical protein